MSFRSPLPVVLGLALVVGLACEEFPEPLESDSGQIPVQIQPVDWPTELAVGDNALLEVEVVDGSGAAILGVDVSWQLEAGSPASLQAGSEGNLTWQLTGDNLGWAYITTSLEQDPFVPTTRTDSVAILLAGVRIAVPADDTTLTAVGDQVVLASEGLNAQGAGAQVGGMQWTVISGSSVTPLSTTQADQVTVEATSEGTTVIAVTNALCVSTGTCADTISVTVDQRADSVDVTPATDSLVSGDTVQLSAAVFDANANDAPNETVTWTSRSTAVATVDGSGLVTAQSAGSTWIVASAGSAADSAGITVRASGELSVELTDAPADLLASAELFLDGVYVVDNLVNNGRRYLLDQPFSVDLLTLADTVTALAAGQVPATTYNNLILAVDSARITLLNAYTFPDASRTHVYNIPGDTLPVAITGAATITSGDTVKIVLDFDVDGSFPLPEPTSDSIVGLATFTPTTRTVERTQAASIAGTVTTGSTPSVADVTLRAVRTDVAGDTVYTRTDGAGAFKFRYLIPGSYDLSVPAPPACHVANPAVLASTVAAAEAATGAAFSFDLVTIDSIATAPALDTINAIGFTTTLSAVAYEGTTPLTGLGVTWSSADTTIAIVSRDGVVTGRASGDAPIVVNACGATDTAIVTVRQVGAEAVISPTVAEISAGDSAQFSAQLLDSAGVPIDTAFFEFFGSDNSVADVDIGDGSSTWATGIKSGTITVEAQEYNTGYFATAELNVLLAAVQSFSLNDPNGCALTDTGQVVCWGPNPHGILGFAPIPDPNGNADWYTPYKPQEIPLPGGETYTQVSTGGGHACALTAGGDIYCWGTGGSGELGNGSNFDSHTPVLAQRPGGESFNDVAAGHYFTCGGTASGQAYCWGQNQVGQLGNGTTNSANIPTAVAQVAGLDFYDLTVEDRTVCAIGTNDAGYCWGEGHRGDLGNGNTVDSFTPVGVSMPATSFTQIAAHPEGMCALGSNGFTYCWGSDVAGVNSGNDMPTPQQVGSELFESIGVAGAALCGVTSTGIVRCTGGNYHAQFGNGTTDRSGALFENGATGVTAMALDGGGYDTLCGLDTSGDVYCWGNKNTGSTGTGDRYATFDPAQVSIAGAIAVAGEQDHTCALTDTNQIYCWGQWVGEYTGDAFGRTANPVETIPPPAGVVFVNIDTGVDHLCALTDDGEIYCLGSNNAGQLGDGTYDYSGNAWVPVSHPTGGSWSEITSGREYNCALDLASDIYCWGWNGNGQLGLGFGTTSSTFPDPTITVDVGVAYTSVSAGKYHTCATTTGSTIYCWGFNGQGQLGVGDYNDRDTPTGVASGEFFDQVSAGYRHTCALTFGDAAFCWGQSDSGQIGDDYVAVSPANPTAASGGFTFDWIEAGQSQSCGALTGGGMKCWGSGWDGQLGAGWNDSPGVPEDAWIGLDLVDLSNPDWGFGCAVDVNGNVYCAGSHTHGDTGLGIFGYELFPVLVGGSGGN